MKIKGKIEKEKDNDLEIKILVFPVYILVSSSGKSYTSILKNLIAKVTSLSAKMLRHSTNITYFINSMNTPRRLNMTGPFQWVRSRGKPKGAIQILL